MYRASVKFDITFVFGNIFVEHVDEHELVRLIPFMTSLERREIKIPNALRGSLWRFWSRGFSCVLITRFRGFWAFLRRVCYWFDLNQTAREHLTFGLIGSCEGNSRQLFVLWFLLSRQMFPCLLNCSSALSSPCRRFFSSMLFFAIQMSIVLSFEPLCFTNSSKSLLSLYFFIPCKEILTSVNASTILDPFRTWALAMRSPFPRSLARAMASSASYVSQYHQIDTFTASSYFPARWYAVDLSSAVVHERIPLDVVIGRLYQFNGF
jgi:hypothetical protein